MLTVVGWLWNTGKGPRQYGPEQANIWARMLHRNLTIPHRFLLLTDDPDFYDYDDLINPVPLWNDWRSITNEEWGRDRPHCYVRLKAFSAEAREIIGERFVSIDLDCLVLKNCDSLFDRQEDFLIYHRTVHMLPIDERNKYQASMWMMTAGARRKVWEDFKGAPSIRAARGYMGTDQAWIRHCLGPNEAGWTQNDGVYGWPLLRDDPRWKHQPPEDARMIFFYGSQKPWKFYLLDRPKIDDYQWIARNYQ